MHLGCIALPKEITTINAQVPVKNKEINTHVHS